MAPCLLPPGSYSKLSLGSSLCVSHTVITYALVLIRGDGGTWAGAEPRPGAPCGQASNLVAAPLLLSSLF